LFNFLRKMNISQKIILLVSIFIVSFLIFGIFAFVSFRAYVTSFSTLILFVLGGVFILIIIVFSIFINKSINGALKSAIGDISEGTDQVAAASGQLSDSSQRLAEANSELAASIEETSATLEESSSMINHNNENTRQAALLAAQTKAASDKGNTEMQEMMSSMSEIKKSSDKIAKIIKVIDEIAFQTNILALNAAVEAARAGDAGMGFAVVAEEVRNLAQRSAQAARDTADIIESNIELSGNGVSVAKRVGESLSEITEQAGKVNELMNEIADASMAQSQGINQINKAISQMEKVTQQNAANADQSAAASEELSAQAESLKDIVEQLAEIVIGQQGLDQLYSSNFSSPGKMLHSGKNSNNKNIQYLKSPNKAYNRQSDRKLERRTKVINPEEVIPLDDDTNDF
jgi:methyl-accepting chemotaxis protein